MPQRSGLKQRGVSGGKFEIEAEAILYLEFYRLEARAARRLRLVPGWSRPE